MIAFVEGELCGVGDSWAVVEAGGIGYRIQTSGSDLARLPQTGETVKMYTSLNVREDGISLYGFLTREELGLFQQLIQVSGIGPKAATAILSVMTPNQLVMAIAAGDRKAISRAPGVGPKTADRIILELRDKIDAGKFVLAGSEDDTQSIHSADETSTVIRDVIMALVSLGYSRSEAVMAVNRVADAEDMDDGALLKAALRKISEI